MSGQRGARWARTMPDEVLLVQLWLSARAAFDGSVAGCDEVVALSQEIRRRKLQAAVSPAGRMLR